MLKGNFLIALLVPYVTAASGTPKTPSYANTNPAKKSLLGAVHYSTASNFKDIDYWTCLKVGAGENYLAVAYDRQADRTLCFSLDGAGCRWRNSLSACNDDKRIAVFPNVIVKPYSEPSAPNGNPDYWPFNAAIRFTDYWTCVRVGNSNYHLAVAYDRLRDHTLCLSLDGTGCRWHMSLSVCNSDKNIASDRNVPVIRPYSESSAPTNDPNYWPFNAAIRLPDYWRCVTLAGPTYLAASYVRSSDRTMCLSLDGTHCRWHASLQVCNSDKEHCF
jgi:hypothetical protein